MKDDEMIFFQICCLLLYFAQIIIQAFYRVSQKKLTFVWGAVAPLNFELRIKVRGVLESRGSQLYNAYNSFSVAFKMPEIFEFEVAYPPKK